MSSGPTSVLFPSGSDAYITCIIPYDGTTSSLARPSISPFQSGMNGRPATPATVKRRQADRPLYSLASHQ